MEKNNSRIGLIAILFFTIFGCKTSNLPKHKKYKQMDTFIEINGLKIPTLSDDKKFFKDTKAFINDRKNSIDSGEADKMYKKNKDNQGINENMNSYQKATKDYLIKEIDGKTFEDITYDETYEDHRKYDIKRYIFKDGKLYTIGEYLMINCDLKEDIIILNKPIKRILSSMQSHYLYYPSGQLKTFCVFSGGMTGLAFSGNNRVGTWYKFNEKGEIITTIDFEKDYKSNFQDIYIIAIKKFNDLYSKHEINLYKGLPKFERNKNELGTFWIISISENYFMVIDDATGKIIEEVKFDNFETIKEKYYKYLKPTVEFENTIKEFFQD